MKKRTTRRTTQKKTAKRRAAPSASRQKPGVWPDVPPEKSFWCCDGQILRNLRELPPALRRMTSETFRHHVNREKNDFANWIYQVIGERGLAERVRRLKSKTAITRAVKTRL